MAMPEASAIIRLHEEIVAEAKRSLEKAIRLGQLLVDAKASMNHGSWMTWCEDSLPRISERTIRNYMRVFRNKDLLLRQDITDPAAAYKALSEPKRQPFLVSNAPRAAASSNGAAPAVVDTLDGMGFPVPAQAHEIWSRRQYAEDLIEAVRKVRGTIERVSTGRDKLFVEVNFRLLIPELKNSESHLETVAPFAVCPSCQGLVLSACGTCHGRGMVSEYYWKHMVPKALKEAREKAIELRKVNE